MKYFKYILTLIIILSSVYLLFIISAPQVIVENRVEYKEISYTIFDQDKHVIRLITHQTELNKEVLQLRSNSNLPLKQQIDLLSRILDRVFKENKKSSFSTLSIGRLVHAFGKNNTQMSERLALAASKSPLWDKEKGKTLSGHENDFVKEISNKALIYMELKEMFENFGLAIEVSSVEKVLIGTPDKVPFGDSLKEQGVKDTDKLPFDGMVWFSMSPKKD